LWIGPRDTDQEKGALTTRVLYTVRGLRCYIPRARRRPKISSSNGIRLIFSAVEE
jgi:hypothetical protein